MMARKSVLVLTSRFPFPPVGGEKLRIFHLVEHLSREYDVDVCSLYGSPEEIKESEAFRPYCRNLYLFRMPRWKRLWSCAVGFLTGKPLQVLYYYDKNIRRKIDGLMRNRYDIVLVHLIRMFEYVRGSGHPGIILEFTDAISMNYYRIKFPRTPREIIYTIERSRTLRYELAAIDRISSGVLVAQTDREYLVSKGATSGRLHVIKNGTVMAGCASHACETGLIAFLGNLRSMQNEEMCVHFLKEILPLIRKSSEGVRFIIIGANPSARIQRFHDGESVMVTGPVEDVGSILGRACVSVCPMRYGAGIQNKILESMALGVPVVTTTIGLEGVDARPGEEVLVADESGLFAEKVLAVIRDAGLRSRLSRNSMQFIEENFQWAPQVRRYMELMEALPPPRPYDAEGIGKVGIAAHGFFH